MGGGGLPPKPPLQPSPCLKRAGRSGGPGGAVRIAVRWLRQKLDFRRFGRFLTFRTSSVVFGPFWRRPQKKLIFLVCFLFASFRFFVFPFFVLVFSFFLIETRGKKRKRTKQTKKRKKKNRGIGNFDERLVQRTQAAGSRSHVLSS